MAHFRKSVRDAVADVLDGLNTTADRVFSGRVSPLGESDMPGLVVVPRSENSEFGGHSASTSASRVLQIEVYGQARGGDDLYDTLDDISGEVETALFADQTLGGTAIQILPPATEMDVQALGESRVGTVKMTFPILYRTDLTDPTSQA